MSGTELSKHLESGYEGARISGWDPVERIKDQDIDGVEAEVLYTTLGMPLFALPDVDLQRACFAVYNDWLAEFCSYSPRRLLGSALIALHDVKDAVAELERCRKKGLRAAMISAAAPDDRPYSSADYNPFWQAAADLEMPLSLHIITARGQSAGVVTADIAARAQPGALGMLYLSRYMFYPADIQVSLFTLVMGGVLERFPKLKIVSAESDIGWMPHFIFRLDHGYDKFSGVDDDATANEPQRLPQAADVRDFPGRSSRYCRLPILWRRQLHVGLGLPAFGLHLAAFARGDSRRISPESRRRSRAKSCSKTPRACTTSISAIPACVRAPPMKLNRRRNARALPRDSAGRDTALPRLERRSHGGDTSLPGVHIIGGLVAAGCTGIACADGTVLPDCTVAGY